jgi:hypothetical protein
MQRSTTPVSGLSPGQIPQLNVTEVPRSDRNVRESVGYETPQSGRRRQANCRNIAITLIEQQELVLRSNRFCEIDRHDQGHYCCYHDRRACGHWLAGRMILAAQKVRRDKAQSEERGKNDEKAQHYTQKRPLRRPFWVIGFGGENGSSLATLEHSERLYKSIAETSP